MCVDRATPVEGTNLEGISHENSTLNRNSPITKFDTSYNSHEDDRLPNEPPYCGEQVNQFTSAAFKLGFDVEAVALFLADEEGRELFFKFMKSRLGSSSRKKDVNELLLAVIGINIENHANEQFLVAIRPLLEMKLFESFLKSRYFAEWMRRNQEVFKSANGVLEEAHVLVISYNEGCERDSGDDLTANSTSSSGSYRSAANSLALSALQVVGKRDCSIFTINDKSWLSSMLAAVEFIPLPFSIALADEEKGFPLMYVNNAFEKLTGYKKKDCLGKSCSFLQINSKTGERVYATDDVIIREIRTALVYGCPHSVRLQNFKANGDPFTNRIQLQPLYDQRSEYRFVIGLQLEVDDSLEDKSDVVYENQKLMSLLPKFFYDEGSKDKDAQFFAEMFG